MSFWLRNHALDYGSDAPLRARAGTVPGRQAADRPVRPERGARVRQASPHETLEEVVPLVDGDGLTFGVPAPALRPALSPMS